MDSRETIDYSKILNSSSKMLSISKKMEQTLETVKGRINSLGNVWDGEAGSNVKSEFIKYSNKFNEFSKNVEDAAKFLNTTVEEYKAADKKVSL